MKKVLTALLAVVLTLVLAAVGIFFWKGGHHAVYLAGEAKKWLGSEQSVQRVHLELDGTVLDAETFWLDRGGEPLYGLESGGFGFYVHDQVLYMGSGAAYTLPPQQLDADALRRLLVGAVIYGRVTKEGDVYHFRMEAQGVTLEAELTAGEQLQAVSLEGTFPLEGTPVQLQAEIVRQSDGACAVPQAVNDAMVRAQMEQPMMFSVPMESAQPAMQELLPLAADLKLSVSSGFLELSETVDFTMDTQKASVKRNGVLIAIDLPDELEQIPTEALGLALLYIGEYSREGDAAVFRIPISGERMAELCTALVPEIQDYGITFSDSEAVLTIEQERLTALSFSADGSLPFLFTSIPLSFQAEFDIH